MPHVGLFSLEGFFESWSYSRIKQLTLFCDNQSMIKSVRYLVFQARTKDMENIQELMQGKEIELIICTTQGQVGDIFTISLSRSKFFCLPEPMTIVVVGNLSHSRLIFSHLLWAFLFKMILEMIQNPYCTFLHMRSLMLSFGIQLIKTRLVK